MLWNGLDHVSIKESRHMISSFRLSMIIFSEDRVSTFPDHAPKALIQDRSQAKEGNPGLAPSFELKRKPGR